MTGNQNIDQVDPFADAAETLLYGDPELAKEKLRNGILHGAAQMNAHQARRGLIQREHASSKAVAEQFAAENPEWAKDPMIVDAVKARMRVEQLNDLLKAGLDLGKIAETTGLTDAGGNIQHASRPAAPPAIRMHADLHSCSTMWPRSLRASSGSVVGSRTSTIIASAARRTW